MSLVVLGLNHRTAPIEVRERIVFDAERLPSALASLRALSGMQEALIVSTCWSSSCFGPGNGPFITCTRLTMTAARPGHLTRFFAAKITPPCWQIH